MRIRAFVAASLSVQAARRVVDEVEKVRRPLAERGVRVGWVPPANLHVTLKFLGSVQEESLEAIAGKMRRLLVGRSPVELKLGGFGAFPTDAEPRVLWVGVDGGQGLLQIAREVERECTELGFEREERVYHPHITVGRVKDVGAPGAIAELWKSSVALGTSSLKEIVVYESQTLKTGSEYVARHRVPFSARAA